MTIATRAINFIIAQEDGSQAYYDKTEEHWDWPGGASGPTIGVGYDCGYVTIGACVEDWEGIVDHDTLANICQGVGLKGEEAHAFVMHNRDSVTIPFALAVQQFQERGLPKEETKARLTLPHWDLLSPLSAGALVSLGYNRGWSGFVSSLPRFREMAAIWRFMQDGRWPMIPPQIANMARLWPNVSDLRRRRVLEARLFAEGLEDCKPLDPSPAPAA